MRRLLLPIGFAVSLCGVAHAAPSFYASVAGVFIQGPSGATVAVPDVLTNTQGDATTAIEAVGLAVNSVTHACSTATVDTVIRTVPTIGTIVDVPSNVDLVLSTAAACKGGPGVRFKGLRMKGL